MSPQSPAQQHYSTYDQAHLKPIVQQIAKNVALVTEGKSKFTVSWSLRLVWLRGRRRRRMMLDCLLLQAVKNKYASSKLLKISLIPQLRSALLRSMAAPLLAS